MPSPPTNLGLAMARVRIGVDRHHVKAGLASRTGQQTEDLVPEDSKNLGSPFYEAVLVRIISYQFARRKDHTEERASRRGFAYCGCRTELRKVTFAAQTTESSRVTDSSICSLSMSVVLSNGSSKDNTWEDTALQQVGAIRRTK